MKKNRKIFGALLFLICCFSLMLFNNIDSYANSSSRNISGFPKLIVIDEQGDVEIGDSLIPPSFTVVGRSSDTKLFINNQDVGYGSNILIPENATLRITNLGEYEKKK